MPDKKLYLIVKINPTFNTLYKNNSIRPELDFKINA